MKSILRILVPVVVVAMALLLSINHRASGVIGGAIAIVVVALIVGIEVPLLLRAQDRRQKALHRDLPEDGFYAERASMFPYDGSRRLPTAGTIVFSATGVRFSPKADAVTPLDLPWESVSRIRLAPQPGKIGVGTLRLTLLDGDTRAFTVSRYGSMARVLAQQP